MSTTIPFSYYLYHKPTQQHYYGIKFAKNCSPTDLWTTYFSSSSIVKHLINEYGADSFDVAIRHTFTSSQDALLWEHKVLRRLNASARTNWINRHNGGTKFRSPLHHSEQTKNQLRKQITGIKRSASTKAKQSAAATVREAHRKLTGWQMPKAAIAQAVETRQERIAAGTIDPYSATRNSKMAESKRGAKRKYLPDGSFIMSKS